MCEHISTLTHSMTLVSFYTPWKHQKTTGIWFQWHVRKRLLREKCPNTKFFLVRIFLYSVRIQENTGQKNPIFGHFSRGGPVAWNGLILFLLYNFNPFVPNAPFLYPLKRSENRKGFWCFQGLEKGCIGKKWVNMISSKQHRKKV